MHRFDRFCEALTREIQKAYGDTLMSLAVFGSWARGTATPLSDIDILLVAEGLPDGRGLRVDQFEPVEEATENLRRQLWENHCAPPEIAPVIKAPHEVELGSPLFLDMTDWCKILFDRDQFFRDYLAGLLQRMESLGTRRHWDKGGYYWEYKPDLRPGEIIEL